LSQSITTYQIFIEKQVLCIAKYKAKYITLFQELEISFYNTEKSMKTFISALVLFCSVICTNDCSAIGFPHNLLAGRKAKKESVKPKVEQKQNTVNTLQKAVVGAMGKEILNNSGNIFTWALRRRRV
jgi:hypothetical protein